MSLLNSSPISAALSKFNLELDSLNIGSLHHLLFGVSPFLLNHIFLIEEVLKKQSALLFLSCYVQSFLGFFHSNKLSIIKNMISFLFIIQNCLKIKNDFLSFVIQLFLFHLCETFSHPYKSSLIMFTKSVIVDIFYYIEISWSFYSFK